MIDLARCKQLLPMPQLMDKLGLGDRAKPSARCPFHDDNTPSFGIDNKKGVWLWNCQAGCGGGDEVDFIAKLRNVSKRDAIREYAELAGVNASEPRVIPLVEEAAKIFGGKIVSEPSATLTPLDDKQIAALAKWRGYSSGFVGKLSTRGLIGTYNGLIAFPVSAGVHYRKKDGSWRYSPDAKADLFLFGQIEEGAHVHCFESQWDALAYADASGEENNIVATRGAANINPLVEKLKGQTGTIYLWPQNDEPGHKWAQEIREVLLQEQIKLALVPKEHKDLNDWRKAGATDGDVFNAFLDAKDFNLDRGACLASTGGALALSNAAGSIPAVPTKSVTVPVLAEADKNHPQRFGGEPKCGQVREGITQQKARDQYLIKTDDSRSGDTNLADTLDSIVAFLGRYMRFEHEWQPDICAVWAAYTWVFRAFSRTPYLYIFSPEASCGKSQLKNCIYYLSPPGPRRWRVVAPSEASLFRKIHKDSPAVFLDEIDKYFARANEDHPIVGILNSGYEVGDPVPRCIGRTGELEEFNVFCPKCFTGIGKLPDTVATRSIHIHLTRQASDDRAEPFEGDFVSAEVEEIIKFFSAWEKGAVAQLKRNRLSIQIPSEIDDGRKREIIRPLLGVADLAGEKWGEKARVAAIAVFSQNLEAQSDKTRLLASMRSLFLTKNAERLTTTEILSGLVAMEDADAPWPTMWERDLAQGRTKGPARKLAAMLKDFDIHPRNLRIDDDDQAKGYLASDFVTAWRRYLPSETKLINPELAL